LAKQLDEVCDKRDNIYYIYISSHVHRYAFAIFFVNK
jgi:hypothetical protein